MITLVLFLLAELANRKKRIIYICLFFPKYWPLYGVHVFLAIVPTCCKPVSQSCAVAISEKFWRATAQSTWRTNSCLANKSFQCLVFALTQLRFGQWSSLPFCLPSLIVQRPARIVHFSLLRMIVKLDCRRLFLSWESLKRYWKMLLLQD